MKETTLKIMEECFRKNGKLLMLKENIFAALDILCLCESRGGKILLCGNGGSSSDCEHIVGELLKEFYIKRQLNSDAKNSLIKSLGTDGEYLSEKLQGSIPAISLVAHTGINSAIANDVSADMVYAQQVYGYGKSGDILIALSTSGNARNVMLACKLAKFKNLKVIALTGKTGGKLKDCCDILLNVDETETYLVQELHLPLYHLICKCVENEIFGA